MPHFRVKLEGTGILASLESGGAPVIGFFTTRQVRAANASDAVSRALSEVATEWATGSYAMLNKGARPTLSAEAVWRESWWRVLWQRAPRGYTFYSRL